MVNDIEIREAITYLMSQNNTVEEFMWEGDCDNLEQEWTARREEFRIAGIRDGYDAGKEYSVQDGFDNGFQKASDKAFEWGFLRGTMTTIKEAESNPLIDMGAVECAWALLEKECLPSQLQKQECAYLWEQDGEMKDRFNDCREDSKVIEQARIVHGTIREKAWEAAEGIGIQKRFTMTSGTE